MTLFVAHHEEARSQKCSSNPVEVARLPYFACPILRLKPEEREIPSNSWHNLNLKRVKVEPR
jgi:hypothetical protein